MTARKSWDQIIQRRGQLIERSKRRVERGVRRFDEPEPGDEIQFEDVGGYDESDERIDAAIAHWRSAIYE